MPAEPRPRRCWIPVPWWKRCCPAARTVRLDANLLLELVPDVRHLQVPPLLEGEVEMNHAGGIRPKEINAGKILICCSAPTG